MPQDTRWKQRFANYEKALIAFRDFMSVENLNVREKQGLIKSFEYTYELGWKVMKDYLEEEGYLNLAGSKDSIRQAFAIGLIEDGEDWMLMYKDRNQTSHTYDMESAEEIINHIINSHYDAFEQFYSKMKTYL